MCFYIDTVLEISNTLENIEAKILKNVESKCNEIESIIEELQSSKL